ncbi:hypothetical protein [Natronococcus jeotgali]|uniref:Uncharacterized protein n=1 Tax=Natronococcus jeotgali DSM 18795 TaxID=1227498 RepID=L9X7Y2_9EURY|nr:hypothetical protein [Natronococcus jeotgali]ELY57869.1 hypothetical protein C492_13144 [Natronococcus jeotgali DSM 18795]
MDERDVGRELGSPPAADAPTVSLEHPSVSLELSLGIGADPLAVGVAIHERVRNAADLVELRRRQETEVELVVLGRGQVLVEAPDGIEGVDRERRRREAADRIPPPEILEGSAREREPNDRGIPDLEPA